MMDSAKIDAKNMAALLTNITCGLTVFEAVFNGLENKYSPFSDAEFKEQFYREVHQ